MTCHGYVLRVFLTTDSADPEILSNVSPESGAAICCFLLIKLTP